MAHAELVLLRHGESEGNRDRRFSGHGRTGLTPLGQRQAEAAAAVIAAAPVDALYSSDLRRALETAAPLARRIGREPIVTPALRERSVGDLTDLTFTEAAERFPEAWSGLLARDLEYCPPGGESIRTCGARVGVFLDSCIARHPTGRVVVVSHGVAIDQLLRRIFGIAEDPTLRVLFRVDNCAIHRIRRGDDGRFRILTLNDTSHLAAFQPPSDEPQRE